MHSNVNSFPSPKIVLCSPNFTCRLSMCLSCIELLLCCCCIIVKYVVALENFHFCQCHILARFIQLQHFLSNNKLEVLLYYAASDISTTGGLMVRWICCRLHCSTPCKDPFVNCGSDISGNAEIVQYSDSGDNAAGSFGCVQQRTAGVVQTTKSRLHYTKTALNYVACSCMRRVVCCLCWSAWSSQWRQ